MAFYGNPNYGFVPGAPQGVHRWIGPQFSMSDLPPVPLPPLPPAAPPAPPMSATVTPQDVAVARVALASGTTGADPGGAGPGSGAYGTGGIGTSPYPGQPNPGMGGGVGAPGGDQTFSGYPGVYAQAPGELNSQFGNVLGTAGMGVPYPGAGTALGALGGFIDASRYNGINAQYGVPGTVNPWGSAAHEILSGIGVPFTDWDLARLFDVPSARARHLGLVDDAGYIGREDMGYGALAANQPVGTPTRESGQLASYPAGFIESSLQPSHGMPTEQAAQLNLDVERTIAGNPEVFGAPAQEAAPAPGVWNDLFGGAGNFGNEGQSVDPGQAGSGFGDPWGGGWYAKGGTVQGRGLLGNVDPPGPDDLVAGLQRGEGVLTRAAMSRYKGLLDAANTGTLDPSKVKGLLAAKPRRPR